MIYWIYILFFYIWLCLIYKKHGFNISCLVLLLYLIGSCNCFLISVFFPHNIEFPERVTLPAVLSHIMLLWIFSYPLFRYANGIKVKNIKISFSALYIFSLLIIIPALSAILLAFFDLGQIFIFGDLKVARSAALAGDISQSYVENWGAVGYIPSFGIRTAFVGIFLGFYLRFYIRKHFTLSNWLFISSFAMPLNNFTSVGRDGFVRWVLFILVCVILFKKYIDFKANRKLIYSLGAFFALTGAFFIVITTQRFHDSDDGVLYSLLRYGGEQFYLFSYAFNGFFDEGMTDIAHMFPIIGQEEFDTMNLNFRYSADYYLNTFPTFVGSLVMYVGFYDALVICFGAFLLFGLFFWRGRRYPRINLTHIVAFFFMYEILIDGFFYLMHTSRFTQGAIVIYIMLAALLSVNQKNMMRPQLQPKFTVLSAEVDYHTNTRHRKQFRLRK